MCDADVTLVPGDARSAADALKIEHTRAGAARASCAGARQTQPHAHTTPRAVVNRRPPRTV